MARIANDKRSPIAKFIHYILVGDIAALLDIEARGYHTMEFPSISAFPVITQELDHFCIGT